MPRTLLAAALAATLALAAAPAPASAAVGYGAEYAGESAFLALGPGASGLFTVFFVNTGMTAWVRDTQTQVDLAACLEDKLTCDAQDPQDAAFDGGWRSPTRYATHTQSIVSPGQAGTFTYSVSAPATASAGTHRFNGALVVAATGEDVRNQGYYQEVQVVLPAGPPAALSTIAPSTVSTLGGDVVTIAGSGFVCSPVPSVLFGFAAGTVTTCSANSLQASTPAHGAGDVSVVVTNAGAPPSNSLTLTYVVIDTFAPTMVSAEAISTTQARVTWSEGVDCDISGTGTRAFSFAPTGADAVNATAVACSGGTKATITFPSDTFAEGVTGTLRYRPSRMTADDEPVADEDGNAAASGDAEVTGLAGPTIVEASVTKEGLTLAADTDDRITLKFDVEMSSPGNTGDAQLWVTDGDGTSAIIACTGAADDGDRVLDATCALSFAISASKTIVITILEDGDGEIQSSGGNGVLDWPATIEDAVGFADAANGFSVDVEGSSDLSIDAE